MHKSVTIDRVINLIEDSHISLSNPGICTACGTDADSCEPDARGYTCDVCEEPEVYGAEELLFMLA